MMMRMRGRFPLVLLLVAACGGGGGQDSTAVIYAPTRAEIPFPNQLLFFGTTDGTVNIPVADPSDISDPVNAINEQDGFSTMAPIAVEVEKEVRADSVVAGRTVRVYEMTFDPQLGAATGVDAELSTAEFAAVARGASIVVVPLVPLQPKTSYMVVLTRGLRDVDGAPVGKSRDYALLTRTTALVDATGASAVNGVSDADANLLEQLRGLTVFQVQQAAVLSGIAADDIVASWDFRTQSVGDVLEAVRAATAPRGIAMGYAGTTADAGALGLADVYVGQLAIPSYLDPADPLGSWWKGPNGSALTQFNPMPVEVALLNIPVLMTVPNDSSGQSRPPGGWPVVIYQPGITRVRTDMLAIADTMAQAGFVTIAIDLPLHGITDTANPFYQAGAERTFDLDLVDNATGAPGADGMIDPSGFHIVNLRSLLTTRDNLRQAVSDLFTLVSTISVIDFDGEGADLDASTIHFFGHSLGGIVGTAFTALEDRIDSAVLGMCGSGIPRLLEGSEFYGPTFQAGLIAAGLQPGTPDYDSFFVALQTLVDSIDPGNYASRAVAAHPVYMIEIVGSATSPPDDVVPNAVPGWPLAGTEPLARLMNLAAVDPLLDDALGARGIVRFTSGVHSSHLVPSAAPAVTAQIHASIATFFLSGGTRIEITDPTTIE